MSKIALEDLGKETVETKPTKRVSQIAASSSSSTSSSSSSSNDSSSSSSLVTDGATLASTSTINSLTTKLKELYKAQESKSRYRRD